MKNKIERKIKNLRTDNVIELCSEEFIGYYKINGINRHKIVSKIPQ